MNLQQKRQCCLDSAKTADVVINIIVSTVGKSPRVVRTSSAICFSIENLIAFAHTMPAEAEDKLLDTIERVTNQQRIMRRGHTALAQRVLEADRVEESTVASAAARMSRRRWRKARAKSAQ